MWLVIRNWGIFLSIFSTVAAYGASVDVVPQSASDGAQFCVSGGSPNCLAEPYDTSENLAFSRPVVAKDLIPGFVIHQIANITDGNYGNGASWIGNSANSWIKIDLGQPTVIDRVTFGRDRLGFFNGRDPGNFTVELALTDNIFANGNDVDDSTEYVVVLDSTTAAGGFTGTINGADTIQASFDPATARYVKLTFATLGAAIDEVEVFSVPVVPTLSEWGIFALISVLAIAAFLRVRKINLSHVA